MAMSEAGRSALDGWRRGSLLLFALALSGLAAAIFAGSASVSLAAMVIVVAASGLLHLASRRRTLAANTAPHAPADEMSAVPSAARSILECVDEPLLVLNRTGRIVFANRSSEALVGGDAERKRISAVLRTPEVLEAIDRVQECGDPEDVAFTVLVPVQHYYEAHIAKDRTGLVVLRVRDLTAIRRAEELRADFVANASHELRTPLAAVSGFIDTLRGHAKDDAPARERFLGIMSVEAARMRRLIEDLLSLTRIELNEHNPPSSEVDVVTVVRDAAAVLAPLAQADRTVLTIEPHGPLHVIGDRDELTQVFQNLLHNAVKYGREGSEVQVRFGHMETPGKAGAGLFYAAIHDQGEGIPREAIPRLTERFYRVDVKRSRERGGTGLGLAIVKHILNRHQGKLLIESMPGEGSTFTVALPAVRETVTTQR